MAPDDSDPATAPGTDTRPYLQIHPTDEPVESDVVERSIQRLHQIESGGLLEDDTVPSYEFLFVATGDTGPTGDRSIDWYAGVDQGSLKTLERTLRQCLPSSFDIRETNLDYTGALDNPFSDTDHAIAGLEFQGVGTRPDDWQLPLTSLSEFDAEDRPGDWPLTTVLDGFATTDAPAMLQVLVQPKPDWTGEADDRDLALEKNTDLPRDVALKEIRTFLLGDSRASTSRTSPQKPQRTRARRTDVARDSKGDPSGRITDPSIPEPNARRMEQLRTVDTRQSFTVNARAIAVDTDTGDAERTLQAIAPAFETLEGDYYTIDATVHAPGTAAAASVFEDLRNRAVYTDPTSIRHKLPGTHNTSRAIVTDPSTVGGFCLSDGPSLSSDASRALETTPTERTGLELPPRSVLNRYLETSGMRVGHPKTADRTTLDAEFSLPPGVQRLHTTLFGTTGAGKTALGQGMHLTNHGATDGATIHIDHKGDGGPEDYARTHFARYDGLEDVHYFECETFLPVFRFLSLEPLLESGIARERAVEMVTEAYIETLRAAGKEDLSDAKASYAALKHLVKSQFDPVHGDETISQHDIEEAATQFKETGNPPPVSDAALHRKLTRIGANTSTTFDEIMNGAIRRIEKATNDGRLAPLFTAQPDDEGAGEFDFREKLDEDCVIVFDMSGFGEEARRLLAIAILGQLWRALERRAAETGTAEPPLVNCYIEEAADIATTGVLDTLLSQGRAFGLAVTLAMQFPEQVKEDHPRVYAELLNDVGTIITGSVGVDRRLSERLATSDLDADAVAARLRDLERGEWLIRPGAGFDEPKPQPFIMESAPLPPGHPDGDEPLTGTEATLFESAFEAAKARTRDKYGVEVGRQASDRPEPGTSASSSESASDSVTAAMSPIPHSERFPDCITYIDEPPFPLVCTECETRYPATADGMRQAIECHHSLADVDRESIPICSLDLQLTADERAASDYMDAQLRFLTAVHMAHQQRFDPELEYDIVWDSMTDLRAYVGIDTEGVDELVDDGLLRVDCTRPHKLLTVTPEGRSEIGAGHREGIAHGDGKGDLSESSLHVAMVEVGARLLEQKYVGPDAPGTEVRRYHEVDGGRLDVAVLDEDGDPVATLEAERINNDRAEAIPSDYDTMAGCDPMEAWWIVKTRADGHAVLSALHDTPDGVSRGEKTYSENTAPREYRIDTPGLTEVRTFEYARGQLESDRGK